MFMNEHYKPHQKDLIEKWEKIISHASDQAKSAKEEFRSNAWFVGGATAVGVAFNSSVQGGFYGALAVATIPLVWMTYYHYQSYSKQHFYNEFKKHASAIHNDFLIKNDTVSTEFPNTYEVEKDFKQNHYKQPSFRLCYKSQSYIYQRGPSLIRVEIQTHHVK